VTAEEQKELLVREGMTATLLDDLGRMVEEFETAIEAVRTGRRDHVGARADTCYRFGMDPEMMTEWKAAGE